MNVPTSTDHNETLVSIIIPVYQAEDYLKECIQSVIGQTYRELDILLIDDGSTDRSGRICDEYAAEDMRIRAIHQQNKGLAGARNTGLMTAKGQYIAFVDADDVVADCYVEQMLVLLKRYHADIAVCNYDRKEKDFNLGMSARHSREYCISSEQMLKEWHGRRKRLETVVWNKLYRREVLSDGKRMILFPEGKIHEDVYISHLIVKNAGRVAITERELYGYRIHKNSITGRALTEDMIDQSIEAQLARLEFFRQEGMQTSYRRCLNGLVKHVGVFWLKERVGN